MAGAWAMLISDDHLWPWLWLGSNPSSVTSGRLLNLSGLQYTSVSGVTMVLAHRTSAVLDKSQRRVTSNTSCVWFGPANDARNS